MDERLARLRSMFTNFKTSSEQRRSFFSPRLRIVMDGAKRLACRHFVAEFVMHDNSNRRIDRVFFLLAPTAEDHRCDANGVTIHLRYESTMGTEDFDGMLGGWQQRRIVNNARVSTLQRDHLVKFFQAGSRVQ